MTKTVVAERYGGPEVLALHDVELPPPGDGQVLVAVRAAGANPVDYKLYSGQMGADPTALPMPVGMEASGVVIEAPARAAGLHRPAAGRRRGDRHQHPQRLLRTRDRRGRRDRPQTGESDLRGGRRSAAGRRDRLAPVDEHECGDRRHRPDPRRRPVASGRWPSNWRSRAAPGRSPPRARRVTNSCAAGAEPVEYGPGLADRVRAIGVPDAALDLVGTDEALDTSVELVADRCRIATIAGFARAGELGIAALSGAGDGQAIRDAARPELIRLAAAGQLTVTVDKVFPLADAADAHRYLQSGHAHGKVVLVP